MLKINKLILFLSLFFSLSISADVLSQLSHPVHQGNSKKSSYNIPSLFNEQRDYPFQKHFNTKTKNLKIPLIKLDSSINFSCRKISKSIWEYDERGNNSSQMIYFINELGVWQQEYIFEFFYDENDRLVAKNDHIILLDGNKFSLYWEYEYNQYGDMILEKEIFFDYETDENGNQIEIKKFNWKTEFKYNQDHKILSEVIYYRSKETGEWIFNSLDDYDYDLKGNLIRSRYALWDKTNQTWDYKWMDQYTYEGLNRLKTNTFSRKNEVTGQLEVSSMYVYQYDRSWKSIEKTYFIWLDCWNPSGKWIYEYDELRNLKEEIYQKLDTVGGQWINVQKYGLEHDNTYSAEEIIIPEREIQEWFTHKLDRIQEYCWDKQKGKWFQNGFTGLFFYSPINTSGSDEVPANNYIIFPNPFSDHITITNNENWACSTLLIFDQSGKKVSEKSIQNGDKINLSFLSDGIYFYNIQDNIQTHTGKLVKE